MFKEIKKIWSKESKDNISPNGKYQEKEFINKEPNRNSGVQICNNLK